MGKLGKDFAKWCTNCPLWLAEGFEIKSAVSFMNLFCGSYSKFCGQFFFVIRLCTIHGVFFWNHIILVCFFALKDHPVTPWGAKR